MATRAMLTLPYLYFFIGPPPLFQKSRGGKERKRRDRGKLGRFGAEQRLKGRKRERKGARKKERRGSRKRRWRRTGNLNNPWNGTATYYYC